VVTADRDALPQPKPVIEALKSLGDLRDGALVVGTLVYVSGYATWSVYAWRHSLGAARALDMQYFAIGTPVLVLLLGAIALYARLGRLLTYGISDFVAGHWPCNG
jgi:hypothetical protein